MRGKNKVGGEWSRRREGSSARSREDKRLLSIFYRYRKWLYGKKKKNPHRKLKYWKERYQEKKKSWVKVEIIVEKPLAAADHTGI